MIGTCAIRVSRLAIVFFLIACASNKNSGPTSELASWMNTWLVEKEFAAKLETRNFPNNRNFEETYYSLGHEHLLKQLICHFPFSQLKRGISVARTSVKITRNQIKIPRADDSRVLQSVDYGPGRHPPLRRVGWDYCVAHIDAKNYRYEVKGEELILRHGEETLRLKKYKKVN